MRDAQLCGPTCPVQGAHVCVCVRARARACVRTCAYVRVCVCVRARARVSVNVVLYILYGAGTVVDVQSPSLVWFLPDCSRVDVCRVDDDGCPSLAVDVYAAAFA